MVWVAFLHLLPPAIGMVALMGSNIQPSSVYGNEPTVMTAEVKWSSHDLGRMAFGETMAAVVENSMGGADFYESGVWTLSNERVQELVDQVAVADLRETILAEASSEKGGKTSSLINFASTDDPAATCATADTAGWGGIDVCTSQCGSKRSAVRHKAPHDGACRVLCTLAIDPCAKTNSSWASWTKNWTGKLKVMLATVVRATATTSTKESMMGGERWTMSHQLNDEARSSLYLVLSLLLLMAVFMSYSFSDLSKLMSGTRRMEQDRAWTQEQTAALRKSRVFQPRKRRTNPGSLFHEDGVAPEICRTIAEAKKDFARRGMSCNLPAEGLLSRRENASMAERSGRWKREAAAGRRVKEVAADAVGDGEKSKAERAGDGW